MALTDLMRLRLRIADTQRSIINEELGVGNGVLAAFRTQLSPVVEGSDVVMLRDGSTALVQVRDQDYTITESSGVVHFATAPGDGVVVVAAYDWFTFSDEELQDALDQCGSVVRAAMQVIRWLLADTDRFIKYRFGQESVDRSASRDALLALLNELRREVGAPVGRVMADTDAREDAMAPFIDQSQDLADDLA